MLDFYTNHYYIFTVVSLFFASEWGSLSCWEFSFLPDVIFKLCYIFSVFISLVLICHIWHICQFCIKCETVEWQSRSKSYMNKASKVSVLVLFYHKLKLLTTKQGLHSAIKILDYYELDLSLWNEFILDWQKCFCLNINADVKIDNHLYYM